MDQGHSTPSPHRQVSRKNGDHLRHKSDGDQRVVSHLPAGRARNANDVDPDSSAGRATRRRPSKAIAAITAAAAVAASIATATTTVGLAPALTRDLHDDAFDQRPLNRSSVILRLIKQGLAV